MKPAPGKPLVVKVGGSLAESGRLADILDILARAKRPLVVVPGGGPFAHAVRELQPELGLSDAAAHRMAILAMHQMAEVMVALKSRWVTAEGVAAMRRAWRAGRVPVWLPAVMSLRDTHIPCDWSVPSAGYALRPFRPGPRPHGRNRGGPVRATVFRERLAGG